MKRLASRVRRHLNYATVVSSITAFIVLAGGMAFAAGQLGKNSVGKKQLRANAVTTAKIKKNAVTKRKIRNGAVDGAKVKAGSLGIVDFQAGGVPYMRIVQELRADVNVVAPPGGVEPSFGHTPLPGLSYTQEAGRTDSYVGAIDFAFGPNCGSPRGGIALLLMDAPPDIEANPPDFAKLFPYLLGAGMALDVGSGAGTKRVNLSSLVNSTRFAPPAAQNHAFSVLFAGLCSSGDGAAISRVSLDVIGTN